MPMLIDAGKHLLIDARTRVACLASIRMRTARQRLGRFRARDNGFEHALRRCHVELLTTQYYKGSTSAQKEHLGNLDEIDVIALSFLQASAITRPCVSISDRPLSR